MKIKLIMVGKTTDKILAGLIDEYANRLKHYIMFEQIIIPELKNARSLTFEQQKEKEGLAILAKLDIRMRLFYWMKGENSSVRSILQH